jgi:dolichol-phosphate mannosyltransferase
MVERVPGMPQEKSSLKTPAAGSDIGLGLTIIIPTLNEAVGIGRLLELLLRSYPAARVIVADDQSSDGTQDIVNRIAHSTEFAADQDNRSLSGSRAYLLERKDAQVRGLTASVIDALRVCSTEHFVVMDGDFQHPPEPIAQALAMLQQGDELVICSRLPIGRSMTLARILFSYAATLAARAFLVFRGLHVRDPLSGFFAGKTDYIRRQIEKNIDRYEPAGYKVLFDILRVLPPDAAIEELPYEFCPRSSGSSKLGLRHVFCFFRSFLR